MAYAKKTVFMILNLSKQECENELAKEIKVAGCKVARSTNTKLLGVTIDEKQNWKEQFIPSNFYHSAVE